jgi:MOSC domain-containing protein YiiM
MGEQGRIRQVNVSAGGVPKLPVAAAEVGELGLNGDGHDAPLSVHGGPERALCLFAWERIASLAAEGHPIFAGATGENVTTEGLDWDAVVPGARLRLGADVVVEVTRYTTPCKTNARWFAGGDFNRMHQNLFPGWSRVYARVLSGGTIRPGDTIELVREG